VSLQGTNLGNFRVGPQLGRGGMGTVYRGETTADTTGLPAGSVVAIKVFHPELVGDGEAFARTRREAEIGKEILHEHLVRTHGIEHAEHDGREYHFLVMELIEGRTLKHLLAELGTFPEHLLYVVADQILDALHAIHERGVVHRDVKPDNVFITPDHRVLLMDLGVARRQAGRRLRQEGTFIGSLAYAAPEQLTAEDAGPRADLYALGLTLYELATGQQPYDRDTFADIVAAKLREEVAAPRVVSPDLSPFWDQVILTCVRREPSDRFGSARALRRVLAEGENSEWFRLRQAGRTVPSAEPALRLLRPMRPTPLIGRSSETRRLRAAHEGALRDGGVLLLAGPSGVGKSRLLHDYLEAAVGAGGPAVAAGRGVGTGGPGYGPFLEALRGLLDRSDMMPAQRCLALRARLVELLTEAPGVVDPLVAFLLGEIQPSPESGLSRDALFAATVDVLRGLAAERPLVLVVEDLQLAEPGTVELFEQVARCVPGHAIFLVGVYATDELEEGSALEAATERLRQEDSVTSLHLENLPASDSEEIVRFVVGRERTVRAVGSWLWARSEGSPLILLEALSHLRETGLLVERDHGLDLTAELGEVFVPSTVRDLFGFKLDRLDETLRETVEMAAVLGTEFEASLLARVLGEPPIEILQRLASLERRHRLLRSSGKSSFRLASPQLRDTIYEGIPLALRSAYHGVAADALLAEPDPDDRTACALLRHLLHADRPLEGAPALEAALRYMLANFNAGYATPFLEKLSVAFETAAPEERFAIAMAQWSFYELLASREDQLRVLAQARGIAERLGEPGPLARVHAYLAGTYWYAGDYDLAHTEAEAGLALAQEAGNRKWQATCGHTLGVVAYRRGDLERCAALWREALRIRREIGDRRGEASSLQALAFVLPAIGESDRVLSTMQEALEIWRSIGERRGEASMLMNIGNHLVDSARYEEGLSHLRRAIERHRETGALISEALALTNLGRALHILGRIDDARVSLERALQLFVDLGNPSGELAARAMLGSALGAYGETEEARTHLLAVIDLAERSGNKARLAEAYRELGQLLHRSGDRVAAWERLDQALAREEELGDPDSRTATLGVAGMAALAEGDLGRAVQLLSEAAPHARESGGIEAPLILCRLARAHAAAGEAAEARRRAEEALQRLSDTGNVSTLDGPEIYFTLHRCLDGAPGREGWLARAREMVEERARQIRNDTYREHFLEHTWPNAEILAE